MRYAWTISKKAYDEYWKDRLNRPSAAQIRKYYTGFNKINRKAMYEDELKDLAMVYKSTLESIQKKMADCLPGLLHYMEEFVELNKQQEGVSERLENLKAKMNPKEEGDDE